MTAEYPPNSVIRIGGWPDEYFAIVTSETRVRYVEWARQPWRCDTCGWHTTPTCPHQRAAAQAAKKEWPA